MGFPYPATVHANLGDGDDQAQDSWGRNKGTQTSGANGESCTAVRCPVTLEFNGEAGNDDLEALDANSFKEVILNGGEGNDRLLVNIDEIQDPTAAESATGHARISGGPGDDTIELGYRFPGTSSYPTVDSVVECGSGFDKVSNAGPEDMIASDCEEVNGQTQEPDQDKDGIPDSRDQCPTEPGVAPSGCPAPVARPDEYWTAPGKVLKVSAPGVLCNDTDPGALALTAHVLSVSFGVKEHPYLLNAKTGALTFEPGSSTKARKATITYDVSNSKGLTSAPSTISIYIQKMPHATTHCASFQNVGQSCSEGFSWQFTHVEVLEADADEISHCAFAWIVQGPGQSHPCPTDRHSYKSAYGEEPNLRVPAKAGYAITMCSWDLETGELESPTTEGVASPAYLYAPTVYLAQGEKYKPYSAKEFIGHSALVLDKPDAPTTGKEKTPKQLSVSCINQTVATNLADGANKLFHEPEEIWSAELIGGSKEELACHKTGQTTDVPRKVSASSTALVISPSSSILTGAPDSALRHVPVYATYSPDHFVSFWFFYADNVFDRTFDPPGPGSVRVVELHQGDWEHIVVDLKHSPASLGQTAPTGVDYYQHECPAEHHGAHLGPTEELVADGGKFEVDDGTHPVVYSALGGHASYTTAGNHRLPACAFDVGLSTAIFSGIGDKTSKGAEWPTYESVDDAEHQPWWGFRGNWGFSLKGQGPSGAHDVSPIAGPVAPSPSRMR
jgi:hypothetical protein